VSEENHASFARPETVYSAISGNVFLVKSGKAIVTGDPTDGDNPLYPRTAIGLDEREETLFMAVVDGKQASYSMGVTLEEFAEFQRVGSAAHG